MRKIDLFTSALIAGALIFSGALFYFGVNAAENGTTVPFTSIYRALGQANAATANGTPTKNV